jgi:hypothetical protein
LTKEDMKVNVWLTAIFEGAKADIIEQFCQNLDDEGFYKVNDIVNYYNKGKLTEEFLGNLGMRTGHISRFMNAIEQLKDDDTVDE